MATRRTAAGYVHQSLVLVRAAEHVLEALRLRHPDRAEIGVALRCALNLEADLTALHQVARTAHPAAGAPAGPRRAEGDHAEG